MLKKNIGIIVNSLKDGGAERAAANLSKDLSEKYNVFIFLIDSTNISYPYKGKIVPLPILKNNNTFTKIINRVRASKFLKYYKKLYGINTVISFMPYSNLLNILSSKKNDISIISIRNTMSKKEIGLIEKHLVTWCGKKANITVSLSEGVKEDLIYNFNYPKEKLITIYNSCCFEWFYKENEEINQLIQRFDFSKPSIVTVGRLTHQKGQWHLLRAISIIKESFPNIQLFIFGQGELEKPLIEYSKKLNISENIYFMGYKKFHHKFMMKCDLFVFPSLFEGLGNVLLEALACGMPIVSTDCKYGPREILSDSLKTKIIDDVELAKFGILVPEFSNKPLDINDYHFEKADYLMAKAILMIFNDSELKERYHNKALERMKSFSPENIKNQWYKLLDSLKF